MQNKFSALFVIIWGGVRIIQYYAVNTLLIDIERPEITMIITKKHLLAAGCILIAVCTLIGALIGSGRAAAVSATKRDLPIYCVDKTEKMVALTFDAAWGAEDTQKLIGILASHNAKATFFVVGQWVDKYPDQVLALFKAGHDVMNHSNTHPNMTDLSSQQMIQEVQNCGDKIAKITGVQPTLFRPPYGAYNDTLVGTLRGIGYYTIQWDVDSLDWKGLSAKEIADRVLSRVKPGSIVLFHNAAKNTPEALPVILEKLQSEGYSFVKVSELIYKNNYHIDHTGKQCPDA